jgi:hypothetical protein
MKIIRVIGLLLLIVSIVLNLYFLFNKNIRSRVQEQNSPFHTQSLKFTGDFAFNDSINSILSSFVKETNNDSCFFEMIIDKRNMNETYIHLRASMDYPKNIKQALSMYIRQNRPLLYIPIDNKRGFFIYTGVEDQLSLKKVNDNIHFDTKKRSYFFRYWTIVATNNRYLIFKNVLMNPYSEVNFDYKLQLRLDSR